MALPVQAEVLEPLNTPTLCEAIIPGSSQRPKHLYPSFPFASHGKGDCSQHIKKKKKCCFHKMFSKPYFKGVSTSYLLKTYYFNSK